MFNTKPQPCAFCLPKVADDGSLKVTLTPADFLGYTRKCCFIIPLKPAAIIVCIYSFIWSAAEFAGADRQVSDIFPDKTGSAFFFTKLFYLILCLGLGLFTCALLLGIIQEKYNLINSYVWYASLFTIGFIFLVIASVVCVTVRMGFLPRRHVVRLIAATIWICLLGYFMVVVNSFKYTMW